MKRTLAVLTERQIQAAIALAPYVHATPAPIVASAEETERVRRAVARAPLN